MAVERPFDSSATEHAYKRFRTTAIADRSETEQLGFRLAHSLDHPRVYPIDIADVFITEDMDALIERSPACAQHWAAILERGRADSRANTARLSASTISSYLRFLNSPQQRQQTLIDYLDNLVVLNDGVSWAGPDAVANWYRRNLRIVANLRRVAEPDDRVVVIYGAGHTPIFEQILNYTVGVTLSDPLAYLPDD